jgi:hypothetical protein
MPGVRCDHGHYGLIRRSESGRRDRSSTRSGILIIELSRFNRDGTPLGEWPRRRLGSRDSPSWRGSFRTSSSLQRRRAKQDW